MQDTREVHIVRGHAGLVAAALTSLPFVPVDSLVMVSLAGPRNRVRMVGRIDLPSDTVSDAEYLDARQSLVDVTTLHGDAVAVLVFSSAPLQRAALAADAAASVVESGREVAALVWVNDQRFGDYQRPHEGSHLWSAQDMSPELRLQMNRSLPTRQHLVALVAYTGRTGHHADAVMDVNRLTRVQRADRAHTLLVNAADAARNDQHLADDLTDDLAVLLNDDNVRTDITPRLFADVTGPAATRQNTVALVDALTALVANTPDPWVTGPAILLAHAAYAGVGNGVLAHASLDRVPADSPDQPIVRVIDQCVRAGVHPEIYRNVLVHGRLQ